MTLEQRCAARGLTLELLAERAGLALATVVKIDDGTIRAQPATLRRLAPALGLEPDTLRYALSAARRGQKLPPPSSTQWR